MAIRPIDTQSKEEIDAALSLNLASVIYASSVMAPVFKAQKSGTIINVSSVCATHCWPEWSVYAAAKAGVRNFSKSLYTELQPYGVRVSCIIPAAAATGFHKAAHMDSIKAALQPEDIADTAVYIASLPDRAVVEEVTVWGVDQVVSPL